MSWYDFPIKYFEDNLIFNKRTKDCWACFRIPGFNYDYLSIDRKKMLLNKITRFVASIGTQAQILIIPVAQDIKSHYKRLTGELSKEDSLYEYALAHAQGVEAYLQNKIKRDGNSNDYSVYVLTKLSPPKMGIGDMVDQLIKRPAKTIEELFSVEYKDILESEIRTITELADTYFNEQSRRLYLERTDAETTQWLLKRMNRRGIPGGIQIRRKADGSAWSPFGEMIVKDGEQAIRPHERDILTLTEATIEPSHQYVKITNSDGKISYQTFLAMAHIPDGLAFPGSEWLLLLQDYPIPSEVCIHIDTVEHREAIKKVSGKRREIKSQIEHVAENDEVPDELLEAKEQSDQLEVELKRARDPLCQMSVSICLADESLEELEYKVGFIKDRYEDFNFVIERPITDQFKFFMEFIPGSERYVKDYIIQLPPQTIAGSMFPATRMLGDSIGPFIGTTGILEKMVFLDLSRACRENRSASACFMGQLGGGKSFNANLLAYLSVMYGGKALFFDPKGERSLWPELLPELADHINIITLSPGDEDAGKLDPFLIYSGSMSEAGELAQNILCEIFKIVPKDDEFTAILEAIRYTKSHEKPCMSVLANYLSNFPEGDELKDVARKIGRRIELLKDGGMAKLLFGTGSEKGLSFHKKINILQIQNLQMPSPETKKEDYTQDEVVSTVLMLPIASFAQKFARSNRDIFKLIVFDESWALSTTTMGKKMMDSLARMGRSLNSGCIFIGHSVDDLSGEGIKNTITYKFFFKTTNPDEVRRVLDFMDLEVTDENAKTVSNLGNGQCLFQDLDGRVGVLTFDAVYEHIITAFNTTPGGDKSDGD